MTLAYDTKTGDAVVVKRWTNLDAPRLVAAELNALQRARGAGVVEFREAGLLPDGTAFLVTDRVVGRDLLAWAGGRSANEVLELGAQVAETLARLHELGLVHGDVQPSNVLVRADDDRGVLIDFGLAGELASPAPAAGALPYLAPERLRGEALDARSDIYGLGASLYRALTGALPYSAPGAVDLTRQILAARTPPADAGPAVAALLHPDPALRPPDARAAAAILRARAQTSAPPSGAPLVGRAALLEQLEGRLTAGGALWLRAPSGMGNTRLLAELATRAPGREVIAVEVEARPGSLSPIPELLRALAARIPGAQRAIGRRRRANALIDASSAPHGDVFAQLQLAEQVAGALLEAARLENWVALIDLAGTPEPQAAELLGLALRRLEAAQPPALVVGVGELGGAPCLPVPPVSSAALAALLRRHAPDLEAGVLAAATEACGGRPGDAADLSRALSALDPAARLELLELSDPVEAALVRQLPAVGRDLADALAVTGEPLPLRAVELLVGSGHVAALALRELTLSGHARSRHGAVRLARAGLARALRAAQTPAERRRWQGTLAGALTALERGAGDSLVAAELCLASGRRQAGLALARGVAQLATAQGAFARAARAWELCLPALQDQAWFDACAQLGWLYVEAGTAERAIPHLERAIEAAAPGRAGEFAARLAQAWVSRMQLAQAEALCRAHLPAAEGQVRADLLRSLGVVLLRGGRYQEAIVELEAARSSGDPATVARATSHLAVAHKELGDYPQATALNETALQLSKELGDLRGQCVTLSNLGSIALDRQRYPEALAYLEQALDVARRTGLQRAEAIVLNNLGAVLQGQGAHEQALARYHEVLAIARSAGLPYAEGLATSNLGNIARLRGRWAEAESFYRESLAIRTRSGDQRGASYCRWHLGQVEIGRGRYRRALEPLGEALVDAEDSARELVPSVALDLARARAGLGLFDHARRDLARARRRAEKAKLDGVLRQAQLLTARLDVLDADPADQAALDSAAEALRAGLADGSESLERHELRALLTLAGLERQRKPSAARASLARASTAVAALGELAAAESQLLERLTSDDPPTLREFAAFPPRLADDRGLDGRAATGWEILRQLLSEPAESLPQAAVEALLAHTGATRGACLRCDSSGPHVIAAAGEPDPPSQSLVERALASGRAQLLEDASALASLQGARSVTELGLCAALTAPIPGEHGPLGLLVLSDVRPGVLGADDLELAELVANVLAPTLLSARLQTDVEVLSRALGRAGPAPPPTRERTASPFVGRSARMRKLRGAIARYAEVDLPLTIVGETGSGKEVVAQAIHSASPRANAPFAVVDCAALAAGLLEAELFGVAPGAFTGAVARPGRFELAAGGTVVLDEVADIPLDLQAKFLRVLEEGEVRRVGAEAPLAVDIRWLATSRLPLADHVRAGALRADLRFRLEGAVLEVPPLRHRRADLLPLIDHFLEPLRLRGRAPVRFSAAALDQLRRYPWPGNVRELAHLIARLSALYAGELVTPNRLPSEVSSGDTATVTLEDMEREALASALAATGGVKSRAAELLGVPRRTLYDKLRRHGLM